MWLSRKSVVAAIVCLLFVGLAELGVRAAEPWLPDLRAWPTAETELKYHQMASIDSGVEVAFVGTSSMEAAIDPAQFEALTGLTAYNAAIPFSRPPSIAVWVDDVVLPLLQPRILVIGVLADTLTDEPDILIEPLEHALRSDERSALWQHSALLRRRRQLNSLDETAARVELLGSGLWTSAGHQTGYYNDTINVVGSLDEDFRLSPARLDQLTEIVRRVWATNTKVVILIEPFLCVDESDSGCMSQFEIREAVVRRMAGLGVAVVTLPNLDSNLFAEPSHLNRDGTERFTEKAAEAIMDLVAP